MIALQAPCAALAARFLVVSTPSGALPMRQSTGQMPKQIAALPATYIEVTDGTVVANDRWEHSINVASVTLFAKRPGDPVRVDKQRQLWLPALLSATEGQMKLGIGAQAGYELAKALPMSWRWDEVAVGGEDYDAVRITWQLFIYETVTLTP
jgi:hypothetical protein